MQISRADVADLIYFMAIARHRSFSRAAIELGVSASALSHALKGLETRLGVRLLNRTTKSVTPTAAGEELVQSVLQPFDTIEGALESLNRYRNTPTGRIRINAAVEAANLLLAPVMPAFMDRYPDIEIDIVASNRMVDVTDAGFDAGIRYGGTVPEDMVARRLSADIRWVIAASLITWNATERLNIRMIYYTIAASAIVSVTIGFIAGNLRETAKHTK
jgi:DNA-binding transcriptional LysR family regulator